MVRIKYRYLLIHILYPDPVGSEARSTSRASDKSIPDLVQFHRPSPADLQPQHLVRSIKDQVLLLYGDYGLGLISASLNGSAAPSSLIETLLMWWTVKYLSTATSTAIVRCSRAHFRIVWSALAFMTQLPRTSKQDSPQPCVMQVVRVSGTIKKAEEEAIRRARAAMLRAKRENKDESTDNVIGMLNQLDDDDDDDDDALGLGGKGKEKGTTGSDLSDEEDELETDSEDDGD